MTHCSEIISDLQTRLTFHEENIEQLNMTVANQQNQITRLYTELEQLTKTIQQLAESQPGSTEAEPPPPHY